MKGIPRVDSALFMNLHFSALIIVELLPDGRLDEATGKKATVSVNLKEYVLIITLDANMYNTTHCFVGIVMCLLDKLNNYLVCRSQLGPRLVCSPIVVLGVRDFHVLVEPQDFSCL